MSGAGAPRLASDRLDGLDPGRRGAWHDRLRLPFASVPTLVLSAPAPRSFTGESVVELQLPGNPVLLERVVEVLLADAQAGSIDARRAEPGEFTARAYLNGRMTLVQAEGVAATIAARSDAELAASALLRDGGLGRLADRLADELTTVVARVEAGIDFTDQEDVVTIATAEVRRTLAAIASCIDDQLRRAVGAERLHAIPWVVLTGAPNAGKSTLFNALLGRQRAVVSSVAGTTRDVIAEPLGVETERGPAEVMLVDIAGLDEANGDLDRRMQRASAAAIARAELIVHCVEPGGGRERPPREPSILVRTKADAAGPSPVAAAADGVVVSARAGVGLAALRRRIAAHVAGAAVSLAADAVVLEPRHDAALRDARRSLGEALALLPPDDAAPEAELLAHCLRSALDALGSLAGRVTPDDVLGRIFARFCIGK